MNGNNIIYWDACIFLSYLKSETRVDPLDMLGVEELVQLVDNEDVDLVTSTISLTEVLASTLPPPDAKGKFVSLFGRRNIHLIEVSKEIALIAHELRDYYKNINDGLPTLTTPDALHVATAIKMDCSKIYTFDENDKKKSRALIPLAQPLIGKYQISILKPRPNTAQLPLFNKGSRT